MIHDSRSVEDYQITEAKPEDRESWNNFVARNGGSFLQSYEWGEFQQRLGRRCWKFKIKSEKLKVNGEDDIAAQALVVKHELPFGKSYLYCPRGPVLEPGIWSLESGRDALNVLLEKAKEIAKREHAIFFRIDPEIQIPNSKFQIPNSLGFRKAQKEVQPKQTTIADLTKSEEELLAAMHSKTRYNVKVAQKHGVNITKHETGNTKQFEEFWKLLEETASRDGFHTHPKAYYQEQLSFDANLTPILTKSAIADFVRMGGFSNALFISEWKGKVVAGAIVNFWDKRATYLHGASDYNHRNLMAPYLLHWEIMKEAKRRGFREYDLWGIDEKKWPGLTRFKGGFGGKKVEYAGTYDFAFNPLWCAAYKVSRLFL